LSHKTLHKPHCSKSRQGTQNSHLPHCEICTQKAPRPCSLRYAGSQNSHLLHCVTSQIQQPRHSVSLRLTPPLHHTTTQSQSSRTGAYLTKTSTPHHLNLERQVHTSSIHYQQIISTSKDRSSPDLINTSTTPPHDLHLEIQVHNSSTHPLHNTTNILLAWNPSSHLNTSSRKSQTKPRKGQKRNGTQKACAREDMDTSPLLPQPPPSIIVDKLREGGGEWGTQPISARLYHR
jgi:hypothetical protein